MDMTYSLHNSRSYSHWFDDREARISGLFFGLFAGADLESLAIARRVVAPVHGVSRSRLYFPRARASRPEAVSAKLHCISPSGGPGLWRPLPPWNFSCPRYHGAQRPLEGGLFLKNT